MLYAVVRYFNYRKDISFEILKLFSNVKRAEKYAFELAEEEYGNNVTEGVSEERVYVENVVVSYTKETGYDEWVFAVLKIKSFETESEDLESEETDLETDLESDSDLESEDLESDSDLDSDETEKSSETELESESDLESGKTNSSDSD